MYDLLQNNLQNTSLGNKNPNKGNKYVNNTRSRIQYQIYNKPGHIANKCFKLRDLLIGKYSPPTSFLVDTSSTPIATFLLDSTSISPMLTQNKWLMYYGATNHLIRSTSNV